MNKTKRLVLSLAFPAVFAAAPALAAPNLEEGNWEITTKLEMPGMPFAMPPSKHNQCMTKKELVPDASRKGQDCKVLEQKVTGNTLTWRIQCKDKEGTMDGEGRITYAGKSYDGTMKARMKEKGGEVMEMNFQYQARHTGPCKSPPGKRADDY